MTQDKPLSERIARAKQLLAEIHHVPLATVNDDGSPHNSPVFLAFDTALNGYWTSHQEARHSRNLARDSRVFLVVFDSREGHGGLFIEATARVLETRNEAASGHGILKNLKERFYGEMGSVEVYLSPNSQRIYCATPVRFWTNRSERDANGVIVRDRRYEISRGDLQQ